MILPTKKGWVPSLEDSLPDLVSNYKKYFRCLPKIIFMRPESGKGYKEGDIICGMKIVFINKGFLRYQFTLCRKIEDYLGSNRHDVPN